MTDEPRCQDISYQEQMPPVPVGDGLSRDGHVWQILHESLQARKFPPGAGDANRAYNMCLLDS